MILGILIGIKMPDYLGVLLASLAAIPFGLLVYHFFQRPQLLAEGFPDDWLGYAIAAGDTLIVVAVVASITYGLKRAFVPRDRATSDASS